MHRVLCALPTLTILELDTVVIWEQELRLVDAGRASRPYRPIHLTSLTVNGAESGLDQMLGWFVRTTVCTLLHSLHVTLQTEDSMLLKPVLECLGPSLELLDLTFSGCRPALLSQ